MNRKTLQKIIDELGKESPRIPYVLGVLETLIDSIPEEMPRAGLLSTLASKVPNIAPIFENNELDNVAASRIEEIKKMAGDVN